MSVETPIRLGLTNHIPDATMDSSAASLSTTADAVQSEREAELIQWDAGLSTTKVIEAVFPENRAIDYVAVVGHNFSYDTEFEIELYSTTDFTGTVLYEAAREEIGDGATRAPVPFVHWMSTAVSARSLKLSIYPPSTYSNTDDSSYYHIRMVLAGESISLENSVAYGSGLSRLSPPRLVEMANGRLLPSSVQSPNRIFTFELQELSEADRVALGDHEVDLAGTPFVLSAFPGRTGRQRADYEFLARWATSVRSVYLFDDIYQAAMTAVEA